MNNTSRIERIRECLTIALNPERLEIEDESHLHAGHAGAREGKGHFRVTVVASQFTNLSLIKRHKLIYEAIGDMMHTDIHALSIVAHTPAEES